jgi:Family of unknown function (DUF5677)/SEC-C motif
MFPLDRRIDVCRELQDATNDALALERRGTTQRGGDRMVRALWARSAATYDALLVLAECKYGEQCGMLSRVLFESTIDGYWIVQYPEDAQALAVNHFRQTRLLVALDYNRHRREHEPEMPLFSEDIADRAMLAKLFGARGQRHWTTKGLPERIRDVRDAVPQSAPGELARQHDEYNKFANLLLHGSPMSLNDRIVEFPGGAAGVRTGPSEQHLAPAMRHAYWSYYRLVLLVLDRQAASGRSQVEQLYTHGWPQLQSITDVELRALGRNGQCPCGSGRKVKDCHGAT